MGQRRTIDMYTLYTHFLYNTLHNWPKIHCAKISNTSLKKWTRSCLKKNVDRISCLKISLKESKAKKLFILFFWQRKKVFPSTLGQFHQHVYRQLKCGQYPKVQKVARLDCLFALLGSVHIKAARKLVDEIDLFSLTLFRSGK